MNTGSQTMTALEWAMLLTLSLVWGGSFFFASVAVNELPPMTVAFIRVSGAALVLLLALRVLGIEVPKSPKVWAAFFGMGFLNNVIPFSLIFWAQTELASGVASILNAMTPIFTVIAAHFLTADERLTPARIFGVLLGFAGVAVLIGTPVAGGILPQLAILAAAASYALASIFGKRFREMGIAPLATATGQVSASAIMLLPLIMVIDHPWSLALPSSQTLGALLGLVLLSTAFGYFLYFRILSTAGATNLALVTFLIPPSAIVLGVLFLGEVLHLNHLIGLFIIAAGLAAIDGRIFGFIRSKA